MYRALAVTVVACAAQTGPAPTAGSLVFLTPAQHLSRASLALRGQRPSVEDLRAVAKDPNQLATIVDRYLDSSDFGATVRELHNEVLLLRIRRWDYTPPSIGPLTGIPFEQVNASFFEEPLRLIEDIVMTDQPYTAIVTADYTVADPIVAAIWGLPHTTGTGWERTVRLPAASAGILASPIFHIRYRSAGTNYNRGRANAIARSLLCHDFLDGDVKLDAGVNLADPAVVANAVVANPSCAGCHQTLDPLASYFFGFIQGGFNLSLIGQLPFQAYDPAREADWFVTNYRPPSYFGQDAIGLAGLGHAIASDPRFARCAAENFASYLTEVPPHDLPARWIATLQEDFVAANFSAKQLARSIVLSDEFRVSYDRDAVQAEGVVGYQKLRPHQLRQVLRALTGFDYAPLEDDLAGFQVLAGGIDSFYVTQPVHTVTVTSSLVIRRAAYLAAEYAVAHRTLPSALVSDEPSVRAELVSLHARIFGELVEPTDPSIDETYAVFRGAFATGDVERAWVVTLTAMLGDMRAIYY